MSDLFISYSRKDKEFVHKLHDALTAQKRDVWVDFEDIPLASEWRNEISAGIEAANSFVFVISPDSAASQVCAEEVNYAVNNKKRIVPILYREGDYKALNSAISSHNWIYCRDTDNFDEAFKALLQTLDTDLDYVHVHTRLLVRGREWDSKGRNASFCLRGADLQAAEKWLTQSADKKPSPTLLHNEYIAASRRLASSQQRMLLGAMAFGLVAALVLAILALTQWQVAQANGATAIANANAAEIAKNQAQVNAQTAVAAKN